MVEPLIGWYVERRGALILCKPGANPYVILSPLPELVTLTKEMLQKLPEEQRKELEYAQKRLPRLIKVYNRLVIKCQKVADKATGKVGDGHVRHVVVALTEKGPQLALSDSSEPHDHYDLGNILRDAYKLDKRLFKPVSGLPSYVPTKR